MRRHRGIIFQIHVPVRTRYLSVSHRFHNDSPRYQEMVDLHAENLASELLSSNSQDFQERFDKKLRSFADGEIPHAADAVSTLFDILARYPTHKSTLENEKANLQTESKCTWAEGRNDSDIPPHRKSMNIALIKSMHHGSFLDMRYRVRKQRIGTDQFAIIYLSSSVFRGAMSKLDARRSHFPLPTVH